MIIYGIFVPFIFHLRQYCDLLGYLFYQEILSSVNFAYVNQSKIL